MGNTLVHSFVSWRKEYAALSSSVLKPAQSVALYFRSDAAGRRLQIPVKAEAGFLAVRFTPLEVSYTTWLDVIESTEKDLAEAANFSFSFLDIAVARRFSGHCIASLWDGKTQLVDRTLLRLSRSQGVCNLPRVTRTSQFLEPQAVLRVLVDIDHPSRSLALYFLGPRRSVLVPRILGNCYTSVEDTPAL